MSWDDVEEEYPEDVPYRYYDWYLPALNPACRARCDTPQRIDLKLSCGGSDRQVLRQVV